MTRTEKQQEIERLKLEANEAKTRLARIEQQMREVSKVRADKLGAIIGRLEDWQHR